jgi:hypothetical protein
MTAIYRSEYGCPMAPSNMSDLSHLYRVDSEETKLTDLKSLRLEWDFLSLRSVSELLKRPRNLEKLTFVLTLNEVPEIPLDSMLGDLKLSLKDLIISGTDVDAETPGIWTPNGLKRFTKLRSLSLPTSLIQARLLPRSLVDLCIIDSWLSVTFNRDYVGAMGLLTLDKDAHDLFKRMSRVVDFIPPLIKNIRLGTECGCIEDMYEDGAFPADSVLCLHPTVQPLVDRGFNIIGETEDNVKFNLPIRTDLSFLDD